MDDSTTLPRVLCKYCAHPLGNHAPQCRYARLPLHDRFWANVNKTDGCWEWIGWRQKSGYGGIRIGQHRHLAHRLSWELHNGNIPDGLFVLHRCDNPACVRPDHLFLGTQADNMRDMTTKKRNGFTIHPESAPRGDKHHARAHPEVMSHGDAHWTRLYPDKNLKGENKPNARFTDQQVRDVRMQHAQGASIRSLARNAGVSRPTIKAIVRRKTWQHVE